MKRPDELIEKAKGFKSTDPIRVLAEYAVSLESPRKTVSDAVDYFDGVWPEDGRDVICFDDNKGWECWIADWEPCYDFYQVCTREEFEAEVERRNGETTTGEMPDLIDGDQLDNTGVWFKGAAWYLDGPDALQQCHSSVLDKVCLIRRAGNVIWKRKLTISKAEAWDKLMERKINSAEVNTLKQQYEITD